MLNSNAGLMKGMLRTIKSYYNWNGCDLRATANNQLTINPKDRKMPSLGSRTESIIAFQDLHFTSVAAW